MTKKELLEAIDYGDYPERMGRNLERNLASPESLYGSNPAMKRGPQDVEDLTTARFKKVVDRARQVTGIQDLSAGNIQQMLMGEMMGEWVPQVMQIESGHTERLEQIALEAALEFTEVPADWYQFDVSLNAGRIDTSKFRMNPEEPKKKETEDGEEEPEFDMSQFSFDAEELTPDEQFELEKHKRNIINALVQGAAKKGHHFYDEPTVKAKLDEVDPRLAPLYKKIMSVTDYFYFSMDEMIDRMSQTGQGIAGQSGIEDSDEEGDPEDYADETPDTKIVATGMFWPILAHEIVKGIKAASGRHGLPKDQTGAANVMGQTDLLKNEPMQLRMGPELYDRLRAVLPDEMYSDENKGLIPWFEKLLFEIEPQEFLQIISNVVSTNPEKQAQAQQKFREIMQQAINDKSEYDDYDDGLNFLGDLGINRAK